MAPPHKRRCVTETMLRRADDSAALSQSARALPAQPPVRTELHVKATAVPPQIFNAFCFTRAACRPFQWTHSPILIHSSRGTMATIVEATPTVCFKVLATPRKRYSEADNGNPTMLPTKAEELLTVHRMMLLRIQWNK